MQGIICKEYYKISGLTYVGAMKFRRSFSQSLVHDFCFLLRPFLHGQKPILQPVSFSLLVTLGKKQTTYIV
jgi:hypothetical protein